MAGLNSAPEQPRDDRPPGDYPPVMALRTYLCLRLAAVGVIAALAVAITKEYDRAGGCLQGSISAYYYTPVRSVFVGALVTLGVVMIVLWGKKPFEDAAFNLAGLVAPVVAFVPTSETNRCGIKSASGVEVQTAEQKAAVIKASHDGIFNNMLAYVVVVGAVLAILLVIGVVAYLRSPRWAFVTEHPWAYWCTWALAVALWAYGVYRFANDRAWFYGNAHKWSATTLFIFIIAAVVNIGIQKWQGDERLSERPSRPWAWTYWAIAALMVVGAAAIYLLATHISSDFQAHRTFFVEAWLITWLAIFWLLQTWDRRHEGAPRTQAEQAARREPAPSAAT